MKSIALLLPLLFAGSIAFAQDAAQKSAADLATAEAKMTSATAELVKLRPNLRSDMQQDQAAWRERTTALCRGMTGKAAPGSTEARIAVTDCWTTYTNMRIDWIDGAVGRMQAEALNQPLRPAEVKPAGASKIDDIPRFKKEEDYGTVRTKLIAAGWSPFRSSNAQECSEFNSRCKDRPEMEACASTGEGNCKFLWKKGQKKLAICTIDEPALFATICNF